MTDINKELMSKYNLNKISFKVRKKDNSLVNFDSNKIINAINKSAARVLVELNKKDYIHVIDFVIKHCLSKMKTEVAVPEIHLLVEVALDSISPKVAQSYRDYRNYKTDFVGILDEVYQKSHKIRYIGDKDNANTDSALITTKRSLIYSELNKELYNKFFLNSNEIEACKDGYIYIHDKSARLDTMNCCLFDAKSVMTGGFEMGNLWYNEPNSIDTACDVLGDIIMMSASMQYGK